MSITHSADGTVTFAGADAVKVYQARALASACKLLDKGIKPNRAYTKTAVIATANRLMSSRFTTRELLACGAALTEWADAQTASLQKGN